MAAYAALLALARSLQEILDLQQYVDPLHQEKIIYLHGIVDFIVTFLENYSDKYPETRGGMGNEIRIAAYEAQDFVDSYYCSVSTTDDRSFSEENLDEVNLDRDLTMAFERIGFIWEEMIKMNNSDTAQDLRSVSYSSRVDHSSTAKKVVFGFEDDLIAIKERLYEDSTKLKIIPIVGMGGIGKTTLARRAYDDSILAPHFDIYAWITISAEYQRGQILSRLLCNLKKLYKEQSHNHSDAELETLVYRNLRGRRYLIVIDDIWSTKAWDDLKMIFPDDDNRSRILLTTRILDVAVHLGSSDTPVHQMNCLNEDQSWELLQERVFGQQSCPLQLVEVGTKIAKNCGGLPLTIVVVAGLLLSSGNVMWEEVWENVSENISSREPTIALQCSKILCFSYDRLPLRLKPCFLYISAFPEDSEIDVSKLIKLWVAEGFLKPNDQSKWLEDVGERYLEDLVNRSLLLVSKKGPDGKLETVGIHDMLREICITKAEEEGFLYHVSCKTNSGTEFVENPYRRLRIHCTKDFQEWKILDSSVRSVLLFSAKYQMPRIDLRSRHVGVLDAPRVTWPKLSHVISTFINLRYLAVALDYASCPDGFPVSISKHPNLETIDVCVVDWGRESKLQVPCEILKMPKLRHLIWNNDFHLSYPSDIGIVHKSDLQTIETVVDFIFGEEIVKILVNLKKLKVCYYMRDHNWDYFNLDNLFHLQNLEDLEISMLFIEADPWNHAFPIGLKKLTLIGVPFTWENMTIIGSLPNLQVLQMIGIIVTEFSEWKAVEGQFLQLKYFRSSFDYLVKWEMEKEHFPCLESLILQRAPWINEIPSGIGEIDTLQFIELQYCEKSLVNSAMQILKLQRENGNDAFHVRAIDYDGYSIVLNNYYANI
ncbi:putative late blight resistance protein homolog R1A-3 isoform X1 [Primulina eburnea]|uniref:putative late blight resistance protein homolog R1A-3 isoform X1 n=1 Tax=Primulina eburnea TaxID=1245227 RepID=UPI003C6C2170